MAQCKGCGQPIIWAMTEREKQIPLDMPEKRFILVFHRNVERGDYYETRMVETYVSHFATCAKAHEFRKDKSNG
jgi:hypothetical protein